MNIIKSCSYMHAYAGMDRKFISRTFIVYSIAYIILKSGIDSSIYLLF